jgi:alpha-amylase/alpha-mannosidase (GH57 family)
MSQKRFICVHGHFYQPPRENAWLEKVEYQDSAEPFHDWNERISHECYGPNGASRILNEDRGIVDIVNNYRKISFNFGPTLLSWLEINRPKVYHQILKADKQSLDQFDGHGSAMAQVYNHIIMPLANRRDKETQVIWGIKDFEHRFKRKPEGMWLAETAVDTETLEVLAENDIKFTVLAPRQAKRYRKFRSSNWTDGIDSKIPYICNLPSGKKIALFFYDGERSQAVAFKGLLADGRGFAEYLTGAFDNRQENQLMHIATDGESYGHHHRYGDMALAYCLRYIEDNNLAQITNYGQYLEINPPEHEVEIHDNSSWSCVHGVERWRSNCGCNTGGRPDWNQEWRKPIRESLDWLRDKLELIFEENIGKMHRDPWGLRNEYIDIVLDRRKENVEKFLHKHFGNQSAVERKHVMRLLEMQRHELLMFTSCAWFFDEVSGIETVQVLQYACRAIQIAESESDAKLDAEFRKRIAKAKSNLIEHIDGANVYQKYVVPSMLTLTQIGMQYAVSSLYAEDPDDITVFNYKCRSTEFRRIIQGGQRLVLGRTHVSSKVTLSEKRFSFVVLYLGHHHLIGKSFEHIPEKDFQIFGDQVVQAFQESNIAKVLEVFETYPKQRSFSFFDMFKDEQIKMLNEILEGNLALATSSYRKINNRNYNIINVMYNAHLNPPRMLVRNLEMVLNNELRDFFANGDTKISIPDLKRVVNEIKRWNFTIDHTELDFICANKLNRMLDIHGDPSADRAAEFAQLVTNMKEVLVVLGTVGIYPELNEIQDVVYKFLRDNSTQVSSSLKKQIFNFAEHINIVTDQFKEVKA